MNIAVRASRLLLLACLSLPAFATPGAAQRAEIWAPHETPQLRFAFGELDTALRARGFDVRHDLQKQTGIGKRGVRILIFDQSDAATRSAATPEQQERNLRLRPEGFQLVRRDEPEGVNITVVSIDSAGSMYGVLELAEQIRARGVAGVVATERNPYLAMRGTKFNIPLDLRTPSYTDMGDSAQQNIATVWDFDFWSR